MKKYFKIALIIIGILICIILIDSLQARLFKNSPIISIRKELEDDDSYVDRGILLDTYYCTKEKDIVTVSYHFKGDKFTCPIDNVKEYSKRAQNLINLLKEKMIEIEILDEDNLDSFDALGISEYGYYRDTPEKRHMQINFVYKCKDKTNNCLSEDYKIYTSKYKNYSIIWAYTDEMEIYELSTGVAISINDDYEQTGNVIY